MKCPSANRSRAAALTFTLLMVVGLNGCESTHETYEGDRAEDGSPSDLAVEPDSASDPGIDEAVEEAPESEIFEAYCDDEEGISVSGTVIYDGEIPASARFWLIWMEEIGQPGFPPCFDEITSFEFPLEFRMSDIPRSETWSFVVLLETDGFFPPMPGEGDFWATVPGEEIDLSSDVTGLVLELEPYGS